MPRIVYSPAQGVAFHGSDHSFVVAKGKPFKPILMPVENIGSKKANEHDVVADDHRRRPALERMFLLLSFD
jgi:hypothetical protein